VVRPFFVGSLRCFSRHRIYEAEGLLKKKERKNKIKYGGRKREGKNKDATSGEEREK
jgi:hypothetical protein